MFVPSLEHPAHEVQIGAVIDVIGGCALIPGTDQVKVIIWFWTDEAAVYATPGTKFTVWHGRPVGKGEVTRRVEDMASA